VLRRLFRSDYRLNAVWECGGNKLSFVVLVHVKLLPREIRELAEHAHFVRFNSLFLLGCGKKQQFVNVLVYVHCTHNKKSFNQSVRLPCFFLKWRKRALSF
jgi:hypothetical protein